ncbi:HalOD1 output domain-containing protein [Haloarcula pelagica]|uniref:HalOD1 output domain-containing protein n=1 Tax=Haloarcula pelagica TaxID=3033389 RepID=UPI0024C3674B|nr:HalOD1 output domain-containing protein [Halomicroarcula sp. YJ-61-S]
MSQPETSVSVRVVEAVARARGADPQALPPLQNAIEAEAMDAMYTHASADSAERTPPTILFSYAGYEVRVRSATDIEVREPTVESAGSTET